MEHPPRPSPEALNGTARIPYLFVLDEMEAAGNGDAGVALWQMLRNVRGRIDAGDELPGVLLMGESGELLDAVPELRTTLRGMTRLLRETRPDDDTRDGLVLGCAHLGLWAEGMGACRTALCFFALAEELDPERPHLGYHIGRLARKLALYDLAEPWLKWAHRKSRAAAQWEVAALCASGLGNLYRQRGNLPLARRFHRFCLRIARRHDLRTLEGDALYDLAGMSFDADEEQTAMNYVADALAAYGPGHGRVYALAHDVAWFWMDRAGRFTDAAELLLALVDHLWEPRRRLLLFANLSRAAAGAGWSSVFESGWNETWGLIRQQPSMDGHAAALIQLALGAGTLGFWDRAEIAGVEALRISRCREEGEFVIQAEAILGAVRPAGTLQDERDAIFSDRGRAPGKPLREIVAATSDALVGAMRDRRDNAPQGPAYPFASVVACSLAG
jgi:tetratricopeptide (TPR) repeat protein